MAIFVGDEDTRCRGRMNRDTFVGGSLIAKDVILTDAHCHVENAYTVVLSRHNRDETNNGEVWRSRKTDPFPIRNTIRCRLITTS
jgi:hypothetical protein